MRVLGEVHEEPSFIDVKLGPLAILKMTSELAGSLWVRVTHSASLYAERRLYFCLSPWSGYVTAVNYWQGVSTEVGIIVSRGKGGLSTT